MAFVFEKGRRHGRKREKKLFPSIFHNKTLYHTSSIFQVLIGNSEPSFDNLHSHKKVVFIFNPFPSSKILDWVKVIA